MTRINLSIEPWELCDQHLLAEYKELPRVQTLLMKKLEKQSIGDILKEIPKDFTLGKGHVKFFLSTQRYLYLRFHELKAELLKRGVNAQIDYQIKLQQEIHFQQFWGDPFWNTLKYDMSLIRAKMHLRLLEREPKKATYNGDPITNWREFVLYSSGVLIQACGEVCPYRRKEGL